LMVALMVGFMIDLVIGWADLWAVRTVVSDEELVH
jgi:hypothetical protein